MKAAGTSLAVLRVRGGSFAFPVQCDKGLINTTATCGGTLGLAPSSLDT